MVALNTFKTTANLCMENFDRRRHKKSLLSLRSFAAALCCSTAIIASSLPASGANITWNGVTSTDFATGTNWTGNVAPGGADTAIVTGATTPNQPTVSIGTVTINALNLGTANGGFANLSQGGGSTFVVNTVTSIGGSVGSDGLLSVSGAGTSFLNGGQLSVGAVNNGAINISGGGYLHALGDVYVGQTTATTQPNANGSITVAGVGSILETDGTTEVGHNFSNTASSAGKININAGSLWRANGDVTVGALNYGSIIVSGGSVTTAHTGAANQFVLGGLTGGQTTGTGILNVRQGGTFTTGTNDTFRVGNYGNGQALFENSSTANFGGIAEIGGNGTGVVTATTGSVLNFNNTLNIGNGSNGTLTIDAATANFGGAGYVTTAGGGSSNAEINFLNGATINLNAAANPNWVISGLGTTVINTDQSTVTATGPRTIFLAGNIGGQATLNLTNNSTWSGDLDFRLGSAGTGVINVDSTSTLSSTYIGSIFVGASLNTRTNANGTLNVNGGTASFAGGIMVGRSAGQGAINVNSGGSLTSASGSVLVGGLVATDTGVGAISVQGAGSSFAGQYFGIGGTSTGSVIVADNGSITSSGFFVVGGQAGGVGTVTVSTGGSINAADFHLSHANVALNDTATLNIGAGANAVAAAPGTINVGAITMGRGTSVINFNHTGTAYTFAPDIDNTGSVSANVNAQAGTTIATGTWSAGTDVTINGGKLIANGTIGGDVTVISGTLGGSGNLIGNLTLNGGTIAPGNSIGTLNVGNTTLGAGSTYAVEVNGAGQSDLINSTGTVTIDPTSVVAVTPENGIDTGQNYGVPITYTIVTATTAVTGTFASVSDSFAFLDSALTYDATNVYMTLTRNLTAFNSVSASPNQSATASAVQALGNANPVYNAVVGLTATQAQAAFDLLSGEIHSSLKAGLVEDQRHVRKAALDRSTSAKGQGYGIWSHAYGAIGQLSGDGNASNAASAQAGIVIGADAMFAEGWHMGFLGGLSQSYTQIGQLRSKADATGFHFGVYGGVDAGPVNLDIGGTISQINIHASRDVVFPGFAETVTSSYGATLAQLFGELSYDMEMGEWTATPFINVSHTIGRVGAFTETGGNSALTGAASMLQATFASLGLRAETDMSGNGWSGKGYASIGVRAAFGDITPATDLSFGAGPAFSTQGASVGRYAGAVELGTLFDLGGGTELDLNYSGVLSVNYGNHAVRATLSVAF